MNYTFILILLFSLSLQYSYAQRIDSTQLKLDYGSKHAEVNELFSLQNIDYFRITSRDTTLKNQYFLFTTKEYWNKKLVKVDTLMIGEDAEAASISEKDTLLVFSLMTRPKGKKTIDFSYNLSRFGTVRTYKKKNKENYSLRDALNSHGEYVSVPLNNSFPLFVYSLPYEDPRYPGYLFYCELTANGVPPEQWGKKYGVEHYIIVEVSILDKSKKINR